MVCLSSGLIDPYKAIKSSVLISAGVSLLGIFEFFGIQPYASYYLFDNPWFNYDNRIIDGLPRIASSIGNPLVLSGYLLMFFPFTLYIREKESKKLWWNIVVVIHLLALVFTVSRSAFLVVAVILLYYLYKTMNPLKVSGFLLVFLIAATGIYFVLEKYNLYTMFMERVLFKTQSESFSIRAYAYVIVQDVLKQNFFFGKGIELNNYLLTYGSIRIQTLDNVFLTVLAGSGIIGFMLFMIPLISLANRYRKLKGMEQFVGVAMLLSFIGMGASYNILYFEATWGVFWFLTGILLLLINSKSQTCEETKTD